MKKKSILVLGFLVCACLVTGLVYWGSWLDNKGSTKHKNDVIFNGFSSYWIQDGMDYVSGIKSEEYRLFDKETKKEYSFVNTPFWEEGIIIVYPYQDEFYFFHEQDKSYALYHYDKLFQSEKLYEVSEGYSLQNQLLGEKEESFQGLTAFVEISNRMPVQFVVTQNSVFYLNGNGISKRDLKGKQEEEILSFEYQSPYLSLYNNQLFYVEEDYMLRSYDIETKQVTEYPQIFGEEYVVTQYGIVYNNFFEEDELFFYDFHTEKSSSLEIGAPEFYDAQVDRLYYALNGQLYSKSLMDEENAILGELDVPIAGIKKLSDSDTIAYCFSNDDGELDIGFFEIE